MDNSLFAKRLIQERNKNNLTQYELAELLGVSQGLISQYEKGLNLPNLELFVKLTLVLDCTPNTLLQDYLNKEDIGGVTEFIDSAIRSAHKKSDNWFFLFLFWL